MKKEGPCAVCGLRGFYPTKWGLVCWKHRVVVDLFRTALADGARARHDTSGLAARLRDRPDE